LVGYEVFNVTTVDIGNGETFLFSMLYNPNTQRFVTSFRGTVGNTELMIEVLESIIPVQYTIHNIENAWVDNYFQSRYVNFMRSTLIDLLHKAVV